MWFGKLSGLPNGAGRGWEGPHPWMAPGLWRSLACLCDGLCVPCGTGGARMSGKLLCSGRGQQQALPSV